MKFVKISSKRTYVFVQYKKNSNLGSYNIIEGWSGEVFWVPYAHTRHRTNGNFNTLLFNHSKTQKYYLYPVIAIWKGLPSSLKNYSSKLTFKKQIKSHLSITSLASFVIIKFNIYELMADVYMARYLVQLILEFFLPDLL